MAFDWKSTTFFLQAPGAATPERLAEFKAYLAFNKAAGLNTITLFTPVPVDPETGELKASYSPGNAFGAEAKSPDYMGAFTIAAHEVGMKVIWKPQFNLDRPVPDNVNGHSVDLAKFPVQAFLAGVKAFWQEWAPAAQRYGADMVVVSTENQEIAAHHEAAWRDIIATVRANYQGLLTYNEVNVIARDYGIGPDDIPFWDALDLIGVDAYNPVIAPGSLSYEEALAGLTMNMVNIGDLGPKVNLRAELEALSARWGKPVMFSEMGIRSVTGAAAAPSMFVVQPGEVYDPAEQANYFRAFLDLYQGQPWVVGVNTWNEHNENSPYPGRSDWARYWESFGQYAGDFLGKTAEAVLAQYWKVPDEAPLHLKAIRNADGSFRSTDVLVGGTGHDTFSDLGGHYRLFGLDGVDTVVYTGARSGFEVKREGEALVVQDRSGKEGNGTLFGVERIQFGDMQLAYDVDGNAGMAYRLYRAAFGRTPDEGGLGYQMAALDQGLGLAQVAAHFIASPEFQQTYGALDDREFVVQLYRNVLEREPDAGGLAYHTARLAGGAQRGDVLAGFSESPENKAALIGIIQDGMAYTL